MKRASTAVILLAATLGGAEAATEGPEAERKEPYQVRYLVFQHQGYWDNPMDTEGPEEPGVEADSNGDNPLAPVWKKLRDSSRYRPLVQSLAVPFAVPREEAEPIILSESWPASIRPPFAALEGMAERPLRQVLKTSWAPPEPSAIPTRDRLRGSLTFSKGRYAHLDVNLVFTETQRWMPWGVDVRHYFLRQSRRMLPNRLYYFDHPRFGVIAHIKPMGE